MFSGRTGWRRRFPKAPAVKDFRYNAWYGPDKPPVLTPDDYRLMLAGQIADKRPWTVEQLCTPCPRQARSRAMSASKAGA